MGEHAASRRQWWARARRRRGSAPTTRRRTSTSTSTSLFLAAGRILCLPWQARGLVIFHHINWPFDQVLYKPLIQIWVLLGMYQGKKHYPMSSVGRKSLQFYNDFYTFTDRKAIHSKSGKVCRVCFSVSQHLRKKCVNLKINILRQRCVNHQISMNFVSKGHFC